MDSNRFVTGARVCGLLVLGLTCGLLVWTQGCGEGSRAQPGIESVLMPNASLVFSGDGKAMQSTPIYKKLKALSEKMQEKQAALLAAARPGQPQIKFDPEALLAQIGLKEEDVEKFYLAVDLGSIDTFQKEPDVDKINAAAGLALAKSVELEKIKDIILEVAQKQGGQVDVQSAQHAGVKMLKVRGKLEAAEKKLMPAVYIAMVSGGRIALVGTDTGIRGAIDRFQSAQTAQLTSAIKEVKESLPKKAQQWGVFVLTENMRKEMKKAMAGSAKGPDDANTQAFKALEGFKGAALAVEAGTTLDVVVTVIFGSSEDSAQIKTYLETAPVVMGMSPMMMVKMGVGMMGGGKPVPMLETIKLETRGPLLSLGVKLSEADLALLEKLGQPAAGGSGSGLSE